MKELTSDTFFQEVYRSEDNIPVILNFSVDWCDNCKSLFPILDEVEKELDGKAKMFKINAEKDPVLMARYRVTSLPAVLFFSLGIKSNELFGVKPKQRYLDTFESMSK